MQIPSRLRCIAHLEIAQRNMSRLFSYMHIIIIMHKLIGKLDYNALNLTF